LVKSTTKAVLYVAATLAMLSILLLISYSFISLLEFKMEEDPKKAASEWLYALTNQDFEIAKGLSLGKVLFNISSNLGKQTSKHKVTNLEVDIESKDKTWAKAFVLLETQSYSGAIDVHWYDLYLTKQGREWKVYKLEEVEPKLLGNYVLKKAVGLFDRGHSERNLKQAEKLFRQYLHALTSNEYDQASDMLIGRARNSHVSEGFMLKRAPVITTVEDLQFELLNNNLDYLVMKASYQVKSRDVSVIVSYYYTMEGWKIYDVSQV